MKWWARQDSNLRQHGYEPWVLTAELQAHGASIARSPSRLQAEDYFDQKKNSSTIFPESFFEVV